MTLSELCDAMGIDTRPIGVYDAPNPKEFSPLSEVERCIFDLYDKWQSGMTVDITSEQHGCPGCSYWMTGVSKFPSKEVFVDFLTVKEGLKCSAELTEAWIDANPPYHPENGHIMIGPVRDELSQFLKSVTFFVTPDQLSTLVYGANYHAHPRDIPPVIAPFGSGCGQMLSMFTDLKSAQSIIGATDIAMRGMLPENRLSFSVTIPMLERLLSLDIEKSFLGKPFLKNLRAARNS